MSVRLDEAWHQAATAEVDGLGVGADEALDIGSAPDRNDAPVGDSKCLGRGIFVVHRQYLSEKCQVSCHVAIISEVAEEFAENLRHVVSISGGPRSTSV
jgi:hypothetical protein